MKIASLCLLAIIAMAASSCAVPAFQCISSACRLIHSAPVPAAIKARIPRRRGRGGPAIRAIPAHAPAYSSVSARKSQSAREVAMASS